MNKSDFILLLSQKLKLIRVEQGYSQEKMASILSISKKTLVEVEKGRVTLNWCSAVTLAVTFEESEIVMMILGGDTLETIKSVAFEHIDHFPKTMGGKIWWNTLLSEKGYKLQQNIISHHFRILSEGDFRLSSSFDEEYIRNQLTQYLQEEAVL